jgi:hypothetical protein
MAGYYVVLLNFPTKTAPIERIKTVLDALKDWMRFTSEGWLIYTGLGSAEVRDRLKAEFEAEDPSILIVATDLSGWSAYATSVSRDWIKSERTMDKPGE